MTNSNQLPGFYAWPVSRENLTTLPNIQELCSYYLFGKSATFLALTASCFTTSLTFIRSLTFWVWHFLSSLELAISQKDEIEHFLPSGDYIRKYKTLVITLKKILFVFYVLPNFTVIYNPRGGERPDPDWTPLFPWISRFQRSGLGTVSKVDFR